MRRLLVVGVFLVAACGQKSGPVSNEENISANETVEQNSSNVISAANASAGSTQANEAAAENGNSLGTLPPATAALRFLGTWATSKANCKSAPWHFTADSLTATDGPYCSIYKVSKAPGGYNLAAQCPEKKPIPTDLIKLRFAESARAMLVESNAIKPTGLIYCGK